MGSVGLRHAGTPPDQWHRFLLVCLGRCPEQALGTNSCPQPAPQHPEEDLLPGTLQAQDQRIVASPGYTITLAKQDLDLKSLLMMMIEDFKKDISNSLKEIRENTGKQLEALKEETQKYLKEL